MKVWYDKKKGVFMWESNSYEGYIDTDLIDVYMAIDSDSEYIIPHNLKADIENGFIAELKRILKGIK